MVPSRRFRSLYERDVDNRAETQSIESDAEPTAVVALLADPTRIPDWAPALADAVTKAAQSGWLATKSGQGFTVRVVTQRMQARTTRATSPLAGKAEPSCEWFRVLAAAASSS